MRCAVIDSNGVIVNIIMAEPIDQAPAECSLVGIDEGVFCDIGWTWDGNQFLDPNPPVIQQDPTDG